ncbi:F-box protein At2g27310-like [Juglans microcarpa x Juglans regia]|uniref:F-box protein At2g27310-like n=1 Tax=Juglans microcarpa x Juglans regia TaxID=2249226 RepID=UPI001B7E28AF|nr:F-box protein At2g27310-like [Juglans microcarpa x Juglans regia]
MASSSTGTSFAIVDHGGGPEISSLHPEIIQTHILTLLDGPTLASAACASSQLHKLSNEDKLWRDICSTEWPSTEHPLVSLAISSFPAGHRSFYSDSFPAIDHRSQTKNTNRSSLPSVLLSAVDIHYKDELILSKVHETVTESETGWFLCSPFRVDLLDIKESVQTQIRQVGDEKAWLENLEENLTLSWIVIDPNQNRAVNISSRRPVSVQRHWLTGEIQLRYATIMAGDHSSLTSEFVQCAVVVTCGGKAGKEMDVRDVSMLMEDMEGKHVNGRESLVVLKAAMESGKRKKDTRKGEGKERFEEYLEMKKERSERKKRREKAMDIACILTGATIFLTFWSFLLFS